MRGRSGITLVEVLVAIFIMGVGLLAILVLFPLGALNMARAIRDDRAAHCGAQASAIANMWDLRHNQAVTQWLDTPPTAWPIPDASWQTPLADTPSYPILIDPFGAAVLSTPVGKRVGTTPGVLRVSPATGTGPDQLPLPPNNALVGERWFTFLDDLHFAPDGTPNGTPAAVQRYGLYTWAYLARRPQHGNKSVVDLVVIVYKGRQTLVPTDEPFFEVSPVSPKETSSLTLVNVVGEPDLRVGGWLLDTSVVIPRAGTQTVAAQAYQVTDIQKNGTTWTVQVDPPLRNDVNTVAFLENAIAVFEKGNGWQP